MLKSEPEGYSEVTGFSPFLNLSMLKFLDVRMIDQESFSPFLNLSMLK